MQPQVSLTAATQAAGRAVGTSRIEVIYGNNRNGENTRLENHAASHDVRYDPHVYTRD